MPFESWRRVGRGWPRLCLTILAASLACFSAFAHPVSLTSAQAELTPHGIRFQLRVLLEDLVIFHGLTPDEEARFVAPDLRGAAERHEAFVLDRILVLDGEGTLLSGSVVGRDWSTLDDGRVPQEDLMQRSGTIDLLFAYDEPPEYLTFVHRIGAEFGGLPGIMELSVRRGKQWLHRPSQLLCEQALTIRLLESAGDSVSESQWEALRRKREEEARERLGISSYAALYSFLYVTPTEVRHEVLVPLLTFESWLRIPRNEPEVLTREEQQASRPLIDEFLRERATIRAGNGIVAPELDRLQFFGVDMRDFASLAPARDINVYQGRIGFILQYPLKGDGGELEVRWNLMDESAVAMQTVAFVDGQAAESFRFTKNNDTWRCQVPDPIPSESFPPIVSVPERGIYRIPVLSISLLVASGCWVMYCGLGQGRRVTFRVVLILLLCVVASWGLRSVGRATWSSEPTDEVLSSTDRKALVEHTLRRVYQAFELGDESAAYDVLASVVDGALLEELYFEILAGLSVQEQGGAVGRVGEVVFDRFDLGLARFDEVGNVSFDAKVNWQVSGTVEHWGHIHHRDHRYQVEMEIRGDGTNWRIVEFDVQDFEHSAVSTSIRSR